MPRKVYGVDWTRTRPAADQAISSASTSSTGCCSPIREMLSYRYVLVSDADTAFAVERHIQREGLEGRLPFLNLFPTASRIG